MLVFEKSEKLEKLGEDFSEHTWLREWELDRGVIGGGQMLYALGPNVFTTGNNEFDFLFTPRIESSRDLKNNQWQTIFLSFKI